MSRRGSRGRATEGGGIGLSSTIRAVPVSQHPVRFDDFVLQLDTGSQGGFRARVLQSPFGQGSATFSLGSFAGAELAFEGSSSGAFRDITPRSAAPSLDGRMPLEVGTDLFRSVFQGQVRTLLDKSRGQLEISPNLGLRLKIKVNPQEDAAGALADLPWELLCDGETEDFFALSRQTSLVRYLDVPRPAQPIQFEPPLRILAVGASPEGLRPLDLRKEARRLEELNQSAAGVEVQFLDHASAGAVREALSEDTYNVLHFMGHGTFDAATGEGMLAFEKSNGTPDLVSGKTFATKLRDLRSLGVVMLNACETARASHQAGASPFRGVATALVLGGVPAVIAMQRPISDVAAIGFSAAFYRHLARGDSIDQALTEGRHAIHSAQPDGFEWATPVLFLRMPEGQVFVARPASSPEPMASRSPVFEANVVPALPTAPFSSRRGWVLKTVAGASGAALVLFALYTRLPSPSHGEDQKVDLVTETPPETATGALDTKLADGKAPVPDHRSGESHRNGVASEKTLATPPHDSTPQEKTSPAPTPTPPEPQPSDTPEVSAVPAERSSLLVEPLSLARGEDSMRLTVRFSNSGAAPLSMFLDVSSLELSDSQGRYPALDSDLPSSSSGLHLAAGASAVHTFDFPLPKWDSKQFYLALSGADGRAIKVKKGPITLEGSP